MFFRSFTFSFAEVFWWLASADCLTLRFACFRSGLIVIVFISMCTVLNGDPLFHVECPGEVTVATLHLTRGRLVRESGAKARTMEKPLRLSATSVGGTHRNSVYQSKLVF